MPGFIPVIVTNAVLFGLLAAIAALLVFNRGRTWFVNLAAQDEPLVFGVGAALAFYGSMAGNTAVLAAGVVFMVLASLSRYTGLLDFSGVAN